MWFWHQRWCQRCLPSFACTQRSQHRRLAPHVCGDSSYMLIGPCRVWCRPRRDVLEAVMLTRPYRHMKSLSECFLKLHKGRCIIARAILGSVYTLCTTCDSQNIIHALHVVIVKILFMRFMDCHHGNLTKHSMCLLAVSPSLSACIFWHVSMYNPGICMLW